MPLPVYSVLVPVLIFFALAYAFRTSRYGGVMRDAHHHVVGSASLKDLAVVNRRRNATA